MYHNVNINKFAHFWTSSVNFDKAQKLNFQLSISRMLKLTMFGCSSKKDIIISPVHFNIFALKLYNNL